MKMHASVWLLLAGVLLLAGCAQSAEVTVNRTITYQTILGWGATSYIADFINPRLYPQLLDDAVEQMGLTRLRFEIPTHEWGTDVNDNSNLSHLNLAAFHTTDTDRKMTQLLLPFKQRVEASGSTFTSYISPSFFDNGSSGEAPAWLLNSPAEYTVWATAYLRYLKRQYAFTPTYYCICNEAGNGNAFTPDRLVAIGKVLGPQLRADGLPTLLEAPECMSPAQTWDYLNVMKNDADIWPYIGLISYHLYGDLARRADIRDFARARNIPTAQTEFMGTTIDHLFDDLIDGGVSTWEHYGLAGGAIGNGTYYQLNANGTGFHYYPQSRNFRQIMHYVRPGDIRVDANCADPALRTLAFMRKGQVTLVVYNTGATTNLTVHSLPTGPYGVSQTVQMSPWQERGIQTVKDGNMTLTIPQKTVLTIYPYVGKNEAPIITDSASFPVVLQLPQQHISLHVTATDPELDPLTYNWRITAQPTGVVATLATPTAPNTTVDGLSRAGEYVFTVTVSDGIRTTSRELIQTVYADNQPPMIGDLHNRIPVVVTLPHNSTTLVCGARDLEHDPLTYQWSLLEQPAGAATVLATPLVNRCIASGMNVAGKYRFRISVSDGGHTVTQDMPIIVFPMDNAPIITRITGVPTGPSKAQLTADVTATAGEILSYWWEVQQSPLGTKVVISQPEAAATSVQGLTMAGNYIFRVNVISRTKMSRQTVSITMTGG